MYYVYILQSQSNPNHYYVGLTENIERRLKQHNAGNSTHTNKYLPWILTTAISFSDKTKAEAFEVYLKSGSGRLFAKRHF